MKTLLFIGMLFFTHPIYAQKAKVLILDPNIDAQKLEKNFDIERPEKPFNVLPEKEAREACLNDLPQAKDWDELKKDIFYLELKQKSYQDLHKKYSSFSLKELQDLKEKCP